MKFGKLNWKLGYSLQWGPALVRYFTDWKTELLRGGSNPWLRRNDQGDTKSWCWPRDIDFGHSLLSTTNLTLN